MASRLVEERESFALIAQTLFSSFVSQAHEDNVPCRVWSIGCGKGDEALLLLLDLAIRDAAAYSGCSFTVFVTDPDAMCVQAARRLTKECNLHARADLSAYSACFEYNGRTSRLKASLQDSLIFAAHDLVSHPPFTRLNLIVCHLALSVYTPAEQERILNRFAYALAPQGVLAFLSPDGIVPSPLLFERAEQDSLIPLYIRNTAPVAVAMLGWGHQKSMAAVSAPPDPTMQDEETIALLEELQTTLEEKEALCAELEARTSALAQAYLELSQLDHLKEELLSLASHELRTPLTALLTSAQLLQHALFREEAQGGLENVSEKFKGRLHQSINTFLQQGEDINHLITDMLDQARLQADLFVLQPSCFDLVALCESVVAEYSMYTSRAIRLISAESSLQVRMDQARMKQVLQNLLSNALKYSDPASEVRISISEAADSEVVLAVQDEGEGIAPSEIPHLFDRFYRVSHPFRVKREGAGLGLYLVAEIVKRHRGRIWVESQEGAGSSFSLSLPRWGTSLEGLSPAG